MSAPRTTFGTATDAVGAASIPPSTAATPPPPFGLTGEAQLTGAQVEALNGFKLYFGDAVIVECQSCWWRSPFARQPFGDLVQTALTHECASGGVKR